MKIALSAALLVLVLGGAVAAAELLAPAPASKAEAQQEHERAGGKSPLRVRGHARGLYPGSRTKINVSIENRSNRTLTMHSLHITPEDAGAACTAENVSIAAVRRRLTLPARARTRLRVPIVMAADAQNGCQNARFPLHFEVRAGRR